MKGYFRNLRFEFIFKINSSFEKQGDTSCNKTNKEGTHNACGPLI